MPLETTLTNVTQDVKPLSRQGKTTSSRGVSEKSDETSSPFAPKTNVNIKNAISDMAGILAKIGAMQENVTEKMPDALKDMINNIMKQAFSLEETLGEGLSSTVESQRFVVDQLTIMARILSRLSNLSEKGLTTQLSEDLEVFLGELKKMLTEKNSNLEPSLLHKLAFKMLAQKAGGDKISATIREFLFNSTGEEPASNEMKNFKKLLDILMPLKKDLEKVSIKSALLGKESSKGQIIDVLGKEMEQNEVVNIRNRLNDTSILDTLLKGSNNIAKNLPENQMLKSSTIKENIQNTPNEENKLQNPDNIKEQTSPTNSVREKIAKKEIFSSLEASLGKEELEDKQVKRNLENNVEPKSLNNSKNLETLTSPTQKSTQSKIVLQNDNQKVNVEMPETLTKGQIENKTNSTQVLKKLQSYTEYNDLSRLVKESMTQENSLKKEQIVPSNMKNTPELMKTMQNLADLLLKERTLTTKDINLLQNFVSRSLTQISDEDAKQLQLLLRLCQQNVPASVQYVAMHKNMVDLPRLWAFVQLCDIAMLKEQTPRNLKNASKTLLNFATSLRHTMSGDTATGVEGERSLQFMTPIYLGQGEKKYPAYINLYDEEKPSEETGEMQKETWLRVCLLTDYAGAVELTCRLYERQKLNVRLFFSNEESVTEFQKYISEFRQSFFGTKLELIDLKVGTLGTKVS